MKKILILLLTIMPFIGFSKNNGKIVTSNQLTYTIAKRLTKGTDILVTSAFDAYTDMFNQKIAFKNLENKDKIFKDAKAVLTLSKTLDDDFLYEQARRYNVAVVDIDLTYSYRENSSLVLSKKIDDTGKELEYVWLDFSNIYKMIDIAKLDLSSLFPKYKEKINLNAKKLKDEIMGIFNQYMLDILKSSADLAVIQMGDNQLDYFLDSLEIYHENIPYDASKELIKKTIEETGIKKVVSVKRLKKDIREYLDSLNVEYVKLELGNIPYDDNEDEMMDENGFIEILKSNIEKLKKLLK